MKAEGRAESDEKISLITIMLTVLSMTIPLKTILNCTNVTEGPFFKEGRNTFFASKINNAYNATHGWLVAGCFGVLDSAVSS